jgi:CheY-like chemotaxis protein
VPPIAGDPSELPDLIVNCCLDARRAMPGGGCLTLRAERATAADDTAETASGTVTLVAISVSHTGNGSTETMRLLYPARVAPVREDAVADTAPLPRGDGELILVVQDARSVRTITSQLLEAYGYRVLAAGDCAKAVAEFARRRNEIAAVVMDAALPVADGACTMRALQTIDASVKVIAVTGVAGLPAGSDQSAAVAAVLPRPFRTEQLLNVVRQTIGD